jgi:hypothetical protein
MRPFMVTDLAVVVVDTLVADLAAVAYLALRQTCVRICRVV